METIPRDKPIDNQQRCVITGESVKLMALWQCRANGGSGVDATLARGMTVTSSDGQPAGRLAAVVVSGQSGQALCLILSQLPRQEVYQALPIAWIQRVVEDVIFLNVDIGQIRWLPAWHSP